MLSPGTKFRVGPSVMIRNSSPNTHLQEISRSLYRNSASPNRASRLPKPSFSNLPPIRPTLSTSPSHMVKKDRINSNLETGRFNSNSDYLKKLSQVTSNINEFIRLLERDKKRKKAIVSKLTTRIENVRTDIFKNLAEEAGGKDQSQSLLRSCKNFELDITTTSELLKEHKFRFDDSHSQTEKAKTSNKPIEKSFKQENQKATADSFSNEMLIYYMLFNLTDSKPKKEKRDEATIKRLSELEARINMQTQAMRNSLPRYLKTEADHFSPRFEMSPRPDQSPIQAYNFNQKVLTKLSAIELKVKQSNLEADKGLMKIQVKKQGDEKTASDFTWKRACRNINEGLTKQLTQNLDSIGKSMPNRNSRECKRAVYLPIPLIN